MSNLPAETVNVMRYTETPGYKGEVEWRIDPDGAWVRFEDVWPEVTALRGEIGRLNALINTPHTAEFLESVKLEAIHQRERWAADHDAGKTDADWFWLVGYLTGKALHKPEKQLHHIITTAAALLNWHAAKTGNDTRMRPGIAPPEQDTRGAE